MSDQGKKFQENNILDSFVLKHKKVFFSFI